MTNKNGKTVYIADVELVKFGLSPEMKNAVVSNAIRARLSLPERSMSRRPGTRAALVEKLGLPKDVTQKQLQEAMLSRL